MDDEVRTCLDILLTQDAWLLRNDANERSITHKFGEYIQNAMPEWNVDCEYNKHGTNTKKLGMDARELLDAMRELIGKALGDNRITQDDARWAIESVDSHKKLIDIYGEKVPLMVAKSLYEQILKKIKSSELEEFGGILQIVVTKANGSRSGLEEVNIYPDIIVHHRGTDDNLVVIESKKSSETKNERWLWDYVKLIAMMHETGQYAYRYGYFINFPVMNDFTNHTNFSFTNGIHGFVVVRST